MFALEKNCVFKIESKFEKVCRIFGKRKRLRKSQSVQDESRIKISNKNGKANQNCVATKPNTSNIVINDGILLTPSRTFDASRLLFFKLI